MSPDHCTYNLLHTHLLLESMDTLSVAANTVHCQTAIQFLGSIFEVGVHIHHIHDHSIVEQPLSANNNTSTNHCS